MNWKQLHNSATPEERLDLILRMLRIVEARQRRRLWVRGRLIPDRRRGYQAHFLNDRRKSWRPVCLLAFSAILLTVSTATLTLVLHAPPQLAGLALSFYSALLGIIIFKPKRLTPLRG